MSTEPLSPKHAGEAASSAVLELVRVLDHVSDREAEYYDARTAVPVEGDDVLALEGIDALGAGVPVEIKSAIVVYGEDQRRGRFNLRKKQHESLLNASGVYLFAVCEPRPDRNVIELKIVPAAVVDDRLPSWHSLDGRETYTQLSWSRVFAVQEVEQ